MAFVLVDNEAFKTTLQIVEDFINDDYDAFIENGPTDDIKLITWKMKIYFKKLEGKKKSIVEYYMIPIYKLLKLSFYGYYWNSIANSIYENFNCLTIFNGNEKIYLNTLTLDFEKNILTKTITIKIICDETYKLNVLRGSDHKIHNYLTQLLYAIRKTLYSCRVSPFTEKVIHDYYKTEANDTMITNKRINLDDDNVNWLKDIIKTHYQEILKNIEAYILYCKTEKIDIDFKKIIDRITYIKEYVKENYDITLV